MAASQRTPPLTAGDRLSRAEFERRYAAMPECKKAELIEGVVYVPSPVSHVRHGAPHAVLATWMGTYALATPGVECADNSTVRLDLDNEPQPDLLLRVAGELGGRSRLDVDGYVEGPPELVAEIAASSVSYDLHDKLRVYRRSGVQEYVVWRVDDRALDWLVLREGEYVPLPLDAHGVVRSEVFPGLWLTVPALMAGDGPGLMRTLHEGMGTSEYGGFVRALAARA